MVDHVVKHNKSFDNIIGPKFTVLVKQVENSLLWVVRVNIEFEVEFKRSNVPIILVDSIVLCSQFDQTVLAILHSELNQCH